MSEFNFSNIAIITHIRIDNSERLYNIHIRDTFYKKLCDNIEFVYIEDDVVSILSEYPSFIDGKKYQLFTNSGPHQKNTCYNIGCALTDRKYLCFLDADCIVHPNQILDAAQGCIDTEVGVVQPYNGVALYLNYIAKSLFTATPTYDTLQHMLPTKVFTGQVTEHLTVGNTAAPGGCIVTHREAIKQFNGFNPLFRGWGYEDNELLARVRGLGLTTRVLTGDEKVLWHLPHGDESINKENHPDYSNNRQICSHVARMSKQQLQEYIKQWHLSI